MISITANRFKGEKVPILGETVVSGSLILAEMVSIIGIGVILALATRGVLPHYAYVAAPGGILLLSSTTDGLLALFIAYKKMTRKPLSLPEPIIKAVKDKFTEEELKGDFYPSPNEILLHILHQLTFSDLVQLTQVNSSFYTLINNEKFYKTLQLYQLIQAQIRKIKKPLQQAIVWLETIKVMARLNLNEAKKAIREIPKKDLQFPTTLTKESVQSRAWVEIIKVEAVNDLQKAKETSLEITDPRQQARAWVEIYKVDKNEESLKKAISCAPNNVEAKMYYSEFEDISKLTDWISPNVFDIIRSKGIKDRLVSKFIHKTAKNILKKTQDLKKVKESIDPQKNRFANRFLLTIVKQEVKQDLEEAKKDVSKITDPFIREEASIEIIKEEAKCDLKNAKEYVNEINHNLWKDEAWLEIIKEEARHNLENAKENILNIQSNEKQAQAWIEIYKITSDEEDLNKAKELSKKIKDPYIQALIWLETLKSPLDIKPTPLSPNLLYFPEHKKPFLDLALRGMFFC